MESTKPQHRPDWARSLQTVPPNMGRAKRIPRWLLNWFVRRRRRKAEEIIARTTDYGTYEKGLVSLVVLSCKRLAELKRLCETLVPFFGEVEDYPNIEKILVDNGSGRELTDFVKSLDFFDTIIAHPNNLGMAGALNDVYGRCRGEFVMLIEDDMVLQCDRPFVRSHVELLGEFPEIGLIRLKNQNNWWKPFRIIGPLRSTASGKRFFTWLPSFNRECNVWACGSVLFRKVSFLSTGNLPVGQGRDQAYQVENVYARKYNKIWLAAKMEDCWPVVQHNDNAESPGFLDKV